MRIGIEAQRLFREQKHGMDLVALGLIQALQKLDKENLYFIFVNEGPDRCIEETANVKIVEFPGWYPVWEQVKLPKQCRKYEVDILHCTSNLAPIFIDIPLVVTFHDIIFFEGWVLLKKGFTPYQRFGNLYRKLLARRILRKASVIITVSHCEKKLLLKLPKIKSSGVEVVYNAVSEHFNEEISEEEKNHVKLKYNLPDRFIMFLGNTDPKKNSENTIMGFVRFCEEVDSDLKLLIGDLRREVVATILSEKGKREFLSRMLFPGYIQNSDMPAVIHQARVFMYPSIRESFGIPIIEAMACGVPVITSNAFSMPEVAGKAAYLVNPRNVESIADGLKVVAFDEHLRTELIEKGKERIKMFSWESSALKTLQIYSNH